jgi:hypothetical protein
METEVRRLEGEGEGSGRAGCWRAGAGNRRALGRRTGRISIKLRSHSSPSSNFTCQMSSASVDTSWSVTTPRYHRWPNFIRTSRPTRW